MTKNAKPARASASGGRPGFSISNWKVHQRNSLQGFFTLALPSGMVVHNCSLHRKEGARWIRLPSRQYSKPDGATGYSPLVEFNDDDARRRFQAAALAAVDRFMAG